jgi:hypothetical protein
MPTPPNKPCGKLLVLPREIRNQILGGFNQRVRLLMTFQGRPAAELTIEHAPYLPFLQVCSRIRAEHLERFKDVRAVIRIKENSQFPYEAHWVREFLDDLPRQLAPYRAKLVPFTFVTHLTITFEREGNLVADPMDTSVKLYAEIIAFLAPRLATIKVAVLHGFGPWITVDSSNVQAAYGGHHVPVLRPFLAGLPLAQHVSGIRVELGWIWLDTSVPVLPPPLLAHYRARTTFACLFKRFNHGPDFWTKGTLLDAFPDLTRPADLDLYAGEQEEDEQQRIAGLLESWAETWY